jgi:hypothetical protein
MSIESIMPAAGPRSAIDHDELLALRKGGKSLSVIAKHFGVSRMTICRQLFHVLRRLVVLHEQQARQWIALEAERLDEVWDKVYTLLTAQRPLVVNGEPVIENGAPVMVDPDPEDLRQTAAVLMKISQRRAKMLGLDAPKHVMLEHSKKDETKRYDLSKLTVAQLQALRDLQLAAAVRKPIDVGPVDEPEVAATPSPSLRPSTPDPGVERTGSPSP